MEPLILNANVLKNSQVKYHFLTKLKANRFGG